METIGAYLRREREFRQITLREVSQQTRINHSCIEAIERDAFDELPAVAFVRGYLKAYAEHVGLDSADVLLRYEQHLTQAKEEDQAESATQKTWHWQNKYLWVLAISGVIVALAAYLASQ